MEYLIAAAVLGICVGIFSAYYQKTFLVILFAVPAVILGCVNFFAPTLIVVGYSDGTGIAGVMSIFKRLPVIARESLFIFPIFVFVGRFGAWLRIKFVKPKEETVKARKKRILKAYGYNKMPDTF